MNALIPNILYPMPLYVIQAIRHLARSLESWIQKAMEGYSPEFMARKLEVSRAFSVQLRRHTSINHLSQASSAIFENGEQIQQMVHDWNRLDLESIREQASWICECRKTDVIQIMEIEFRQMLQGKSRLDQWTAWLESIVNKFLGPIKSEQQMTEDDAQELTKKGRNLILKWGFYSSLALRELTLKSSASFGSFQILRLLFDEYIVYLVEKRIIETLKGPMGE
jgi:regulatory factor X 1/2/3